MSSARKHIEFELNLIPFIDMLSACLSFLLLTAVWSYIGSVDTHQAIGSESTSGANNPPSLSMQIEKDNSLTIDLKDIKTQHRHFVISSAQGKVDWVKTEKLVQSVKKQFPQIETSVVMAKPGVSYGNTIKAVDTLKKNEFKSVGISPI